MMPPLRKPRTPRDEPMPRDTAGADVAAGAPLVVKPIKPNFVRYGVDHVEADDVEDTPARTALVPKLSRPEYYTSPSIEAMSKMSEAKLSRIDNLEIGRYGFGSVRWPGLTDVRRLDFDADVCIERGSLTLYRDRGVPAVGQELNKEAVITLNVRPSRSDSQLKSMEALKSRLTKISEEFGGKFISYDME